MAGLNAALNGQAALSALPLDELLMDLGRAPEAIRMALRNNAGGHANHSMFWTIMGGQGGAPTGEVAEAITRDLGGMDKFRADFNAAGAHPDGSLGERHDPETHLIPLILQVANGRRNHISVYGNDYNTPDGTCVRDYIHVQDLCSAHELALNHLLQGGESRRYNLGNGQGFSVQQVIDAAREITGHPIPVMYEPRRPGDPPRLVADSQRIRVELGWQPQRSDLHIILADAWAWEQKWPWGSHLVS